MLKGTPNRGSPLLYLPQLLDPDTLKLWDALVTLINGLYDMEKTWDKGFGCWEAEHKYRRGGKTLCTLYAKEGSAVLLITLGKAEREKFEAQRGAFSRPLQRLYDETATYHDGKWLWIPLDERFCESDAERLLRIKRRPNRKSV